MKTLLIEEQARALIRFAAVNGRTWKSKLRDCWMTGNYDCAMSGDAFWLHQVRNQFGPTWLVNFKLSQYQPK